MKKKVKHSVYGFKNPIDYFRLWKNTTEMPYKEMEALTTISSTFFYKIYRGSKKISASSAVDIGKLMGLNGNQLEYFIMTVFTHNHVMNNTLRNSMLNKFRPYKYRRKK